MTFSEDQLAALSKIGEWAESSSQEFRLGGLAGSGKTSIIQELVRRYPSCCVMAPTGKACARLGEKGVRAITLHRGFKEFVEEKYNEETKNWEPVFINSNDAHSFVIVDESSMVSRDLHEQTQQRASKVLWIGDYGQLQPVSLTGDNFCTMAEDTLNAKLTTNHRQGEGSDINRLALYVRENYGILGGIGDSPDGSIRIAKGESLEAVVNIAFERKCFPVIVPTNKMRESVNKITRQLLGHPATGVVLNSPMICLKNNYNIDVMNGEVFEAVGRHGRQHSIRLDAYPDDEPISTELLEFSGGPQSNYRGGLLCGDAHALTCHKFQGSESDHPAVIIDGSMPSRDVRWVYTAITRAKKNLSIFKL